MRNSRKVEMGKEELASRTEAAAKLQRRKSNGNRLFDRQAQEHHQQAKYLTTRTHNEGSGRDLFKYYGRTFRTIQSGLLYNI